MEPGTPTAPALSCRSLGSFQCFLQARRESNRLGGCCGNYKPMAMLGEGLTPWFGVLWCENATRAIEMLGRGDLPLLQVLLVSDLRSVCPWRAVALWECWWVVDRIMGPIHGSVPFFPCSPFLLIPLAQNWGRKLGISTDKSLRCLVSIIPSWRLPGNGASSYMEQLKADSC